MLKEDNAKAQSDAAVPGGFDLYFNFLKGQHEDEIAGIEAIRCLELRGVPFVGILCLEWIPPLSMDKTASLRFIGIPQRSKLDSHADAERAGIKIRKVGPGGFPLSVEPAKKKCACTSINATSLCQNEYELEKQIALIERKLEYRRKVAAKVGILSDPGPLLQCLEIGQDTRCTGANKILPSI